MAMTYCKGCLKKQKKIKELEEEVACLKDEQPKRDSLGHLHRLPKFQSSQTVQQNINEIVAAVNQAIKVMADQVFVNKMPTM